jgi:threonine 3-dehydrogenase
MKGGKMKILVTGGAGLLGAEIVSRLLHAGHDVHVFDILTEPVRLADLGASISYQQGDVGTFSHVLDAVRIVKPEIIYHLGALLGFACEADPASAMRINAMGSLHIMEAARMFSVRQVMFASSVTTFALGLPNHQMADHDPQNPVNLYGVLKLMTEGMGRYYRHQHGVDFRAIRFPSVVGPGNRTPGLATYTTEMIEAALCNKPCIVKATEKSTIPILHVSDAARAMIELSSANEVSLTRREYLVDGAKPTPTAADLAEMIRAEFPDADTSFQPNPDWQPFLDLYARPIDDAAARDDWGWAPQYDYPRIIEAFRASFYKTTI